MRGTVKGRSESHRKCSQTLAEIVSEVLRNLSSAEQGYYKEAYGGLMDGDSTMSGSLSGSILIPKDE